jgi:hypothetical protein
VPFAEDDGVVGIRDGYCRESARRQPALHPEALTMPSTRSLARLIPSMLELVVSGA